VKCIAFLVEANGWSNFPARRKRTAGNNRAQSYVSVGFLGGFSWGGCAAMRHRIEGPFLLKLAGHLAMGASLGTGLALALIMMDTGRIFQMIVSSAQPRITTLVFVGVLGSICAVGAAITGLIFMLAEDDGS
jgi:hypothetical protein